MPTTPILIGVMAGIAGGKSTVARMLEDFGAMVVGADDLAHDILQRPEVAAQLVARWGRGVVDDGGQVRRRAVAEIVFAADGEDERKWLESIVHPLVRAEMNDLIELESMAGQRVFVIDVPLLLEVGWDERCRFKLFVDTPDEVRRQAAAKRGWSAAELARREGAQASLADKRTAATHVIVNDGSLDDLRSEVASFWRAEIEPLGKV